MFLMLVYVLSSLGMGLLTDVPTSHLSVPTWQAHVSPGRVRGQRVAAEVGGGGAEDPLRSILTLNCQLYKFTNLDSTLVSSRGNPGLPFRWLIPHADH